MEMVHLIFLVIINTAPTTLAIESDMARNSSGCSTNMAENFELNCYGMDIGAMGAKVDELLEVRDPLHVA